MTKRYLVFNVGCIECGCPSGVVGTYDSEDEANAVASKLDEVHGWRNGGQNAYEVFDLHAAPSPDYAEALAAPESPDAR